MSEELTSKLLRLCGRRDSTELKIGALKAMSEVLQQTEPDHRVWWRELFRLKNSIKHMDGNTDRFLEANIEVSARQKIGDAIGNVERLGIANSTHVHRFYTRRLHSRVPNAADSDH